MVIQADYACNKSIHYLCIIYMPTVHDMHVIYLQIMNVLVAQILHLL